MRGREGEREGNEKDFCIIISKGGNNNLKLPGVLCKTTVN